MKIIRKLTECDIETENFKSYMCESTVEKFKGCLELDPFKTELTYFIGDKEITVKSEGAIYLRNNK